VAIGGIEVLALIADQFHPTGGFGVVTVRLNGSVGELGDAIVGLFVLSWLVSMAVYKWWGFDKIEIAQQISIQSER
jgi:high-affinity nickel-transport protein